MGNESDLRDRDSASGDRGSNTRCDLPGHEAKGERKLIGGQEKAMRKEAWTSTEPGA